jgi:hypothetical protein
MKPLSPEEEAYFDDLERNFDRRVEEYKKETEERLRGGERPELEEELGRLEGYLAGVRRGEISDVEVNIRFCGAKLRALKRLLGAE